ncbi:MAG: cell division protein FtsZ, partial [Deltaproteobacteria bacterium]
DISISGAKGLLMNITGPSDMTMDEIDEASSFIKEEVHPEAEIFWGVVFDDTMEDEIQVTVIATGIDNMPLDKVARIRDVTPEEAQEGWTVRVNGQGLDTPTFQRKGKDPLVDEIEEKEVRKRSRMSRDFYMDDLDYPTFLRMKAD